MDLKKMKLLLIISAIVGRRNRMPAIMKKDVPDVLNIHCLCHRIALARKDASKELSYIKKVEGLLRQVLNSMSIIPRKQQSMPLCRGNYSTFCQRRNVLEPRGT